MDRMCLAHCLYDDVRNPWCAGGGAVRVREVYARLAPEHDITVVTGWAPDMPGCERRQGVRYIHVGRQRSYAGSRLAYSAQALSWVRPLRCDLWIWEYSPYAPLFPTSQERRDGLVLVHHTVGWQALHAHPVLGWVALALEGYLLRGWPHVLVGAPSWQQLIQRRLPRARVWCVPSGIDPALLEEEETFLYDDGVPLGRTAGGERMASNAPFVVYLGRLDPWVKGLDTLLEAWSLVDTGARLLLAGRGDIRPVHQLADRWRVADRVTLLGSVDEGLKRQLLRACLFSVAPSRYEGWCIAALEAQACGKPVVASDIPGLRDAVLDRQTGVLVRPADAGSLAEAMQRLLDSQELRLRYGAAAKEHARRYTWLEIARQQEAVYRGVLEERG